LPGGGHVDRTHRRLHANLGPRTFRKPRGIVPELLGIFETVIIDIFILKIIFIDLFTGIGINRAIC